MWPMVWATLDPGHVEQTLGPVTIAVLALAGLGSAVVVGLALAAWARRRSRSYMLVALALATVLARTAVAVWALAVPLSGSLHHLLEHGLDVVMTALVIGAIYYARSVESTAEDEPLDGSETPRSGRQPGSTGANRTRPTEENP